MEENISTDGMLIVSLRQKNMTAKPKELKVEDLMKLNRAIRRKLWKKIGLKLPGSTEPFVKRKG